MSQYKFIIFCHIRNILLDVDSLLQYICYADDIWGQYMERIPDITDYLYDTIDKVHERYMAEEPEMYF